MESFEKYSNKCSQFTGIKTYGTICTVCFQTITTVLKCCFLKLNERANISENIPPFIPDWQVVCPVRCPLTRYHWVSLQHCTFDKPAYFHEFFTTHSRYEDWVAKDSRLADSSVKLCQKSFDIAKAFCLLLWYLAAMWCEMYHTLIYLYSDVTYSLERRTLRSVEMRALISMEFWHSKCVGTLQLRSLIAHLKGGGEESHGQANKHLVLCGGIITAAPVSPRPVGINTTHDTPGDWIILLQNFTAAVSHCSLSGRVKD